LFGRHKKFYKEKDFTKLNLNMGGEDIIKLASPFFRDALLK
jgi:hypothetical protein